MAEDEERTRPDQGVGPDAPASGEDRLPPAFYVRERRGRLADWWAVLHPPYTAWHLSYVLLGAAVSETIDLPILGYTLAAFFLAVGVSAHALDELQGRPLATGLSDRTLWVVAVLALVLAIGVGGYGLVRVGPWLLPFVVVGAFLVLAYNLEWFGGRVHTDPGFALAWGAFPALTSAFAQQGRVSVAGVLVAAGATALSWAQRTLSTPVRHVRRRVRSVEVRMVTTDGEVSHGDARTLLEPSERALRTTAWAVVALGVGLVLARL